MPDYNAFKKKLELPAGFSAPARLVHQDVVAEALSRGHLPDDVRGINASLDLIRRTRGGRWPSGPVTEDYNYVDLVWHELEFREGDSFTYALYDDAGQYLGCAYLYPMGRRQPLTEELVRFDIDVSWWVTPDAYQRGYYEEVFRALRQWVADEFPFEVPYYSN